MAPKQCTFCVIAEKKDERTTLLYESPDGEDDPIVVFKDIRPAAKHHYLVCPKQHIKNASSLNCYHIGLVEKMIRIGKEVLQQQGGDPSDARLGFHWPPFTSVSHLHLHVLSPISKLFDLKQFGKYSLKTYWFKTTDWLLEKLSKMKPPPSENNVAKDAS